MNIITKRTILYYTEQYPAARTALITWFKEFSNTNFESFNDLKRSYGNASLIANHRIIFNMKGNDYRLIVSVNFRTQAGYVIWFGSHKEYDKINAAEIKYLEV